MDVEQISLVSFGYFDQKILEKISEDIQNEYSLPVWLRRGNLDLGEFYDSARRQYNGTLLLKRVDESFSQGNEKTIGLFSVDLFIPILTYIFGQAYLNGRTGIASVYRLNSELYGLKPDNILLHQRFRKEILHEIGHLFGLIHCLEANCVMRSSTYVEDIDQKSQSLCLSCKEKLKEK